MNADENRNLGGGGNFWTRSGRNAGRLIDANGRRKRNRRREAGRRLMFEGLENRELLACDVSLITNGSFEQNPISQSWALVDTVPGWTLEQGSKFEVQRGILGGAAKGAQHLELASTGNSTISQTVATTAGQVYGLRTTSTPTIC